MECDFHNTINDKCKAYTNPNLKNSYQSNPICQKILNFSGSIKIINNRCFFKESDPKERNGVTIGAEFYIGINYQKCSKINIKLYTERKKIRSCICRLKFVLIMIPCVRVGRNPLARPRPVARCMLFVFVVCWFHFEFFILNC